jgi:23S rRNA U2552 (ribose-2'-O)-methylase RlmE/FtsJ
MFRNIARDLDDEMHVFTFNSLIPGEQIRILETCIAPGGFSAVALQRHPTAAIDGITLGMRDGGHSVHIPYGAHDSRVKIFFADVTMFATEFGVTPDNIPAEHPDAATFDHTRPYEGRAYDLVICDGQVLRTHTRGKHREVGEATRLTNAQLILCLQRIKPGGTMVMLMHKMEAWDTVLLLRTLHKFSKITVFKPSKSHAIRSSFYIIAKYIRPYSAEAKAALKRFRSQWWQLTFGERPCRDEEGDMEGKVDEVVEEFGETLKELGRDVWRIQAEALEKAEFMRVDETS